MDYDHSMTEWYNFKKRFTQVITRDKLTARIEASTYFGIVGFCYAGTLLYPRFLSIYYGVILPQYALFLLRRITKRIKMTVLWIALTLAREKRRSVMLKMADLTTLSLTTLGKNAGSWSLVSQKTFR
jgi:hypothetical protein